MILSSAEVHNPTRSSPQRKVSRAAHNERPGVLLRYSVVVGALDEAGSTVGAGAGRKVLGRHCLLGDGAQAKPFGDRGGDKPQERVAEAGDHNPEQEERDTQRDSGVRGADRHGG